MTQPQFAITDARQKLNDDHQITNVQKISWADEVYMEDEQWQTIFRKKSPKQKYQVTLSKRVTRKPNKLNL